MTSKIRVFLVGGDHHGWALDIDLRLTRQALERTGIIAMVDDPYSADVIHSVNAEQLYMNRAFLELTRLGRPVIAHFTSPPSVLFGSIPNFYLECAQWRCVAQSREAEEQLRDLKLPSIESIPYVGDFENFFPIPKTDPALAALRDELGIPADRYVIGLFQRDSLGKDVNAFKPQKGADVFVALMAGLKKRVGSDRFHVLLAGPRRHWLRKQLSDHGISYSFDGKVIEGDDYPDNILPLSRINQLTNLIDLYVIPSRWEGAPQALFETIACRRKIISTEVAVPRESLAKSALFGNLAEGIDLVTRDMQTDVLSSAIDANYRRVVEKHSVDSVSTHWKEIYQRIASPQPGTSPARAHASPSRRLFGFDSVTSKIVRKSVSAIARVRRRFASGKTINLWGEILEGPYGGGSQFFKALSGELRRRGYRVLNNGAHAADGHIMNSAFFNLAKARSTMLAADVPSPVIHRIDGPISLYRGSDRRIDDEVFQLNRELATVTVFQSYYSWSESLKMGFTPVNPMIIPNASDPACFHPNRSHAGADRLAHRKVRLISSSWSMNERKGFKTYQYLDETLDFQRFEYVFVGRSPVPFRNIRLVDAVPSRELGEQLRAADIYITASVNDPASNSLNEAIHCGLPVVFARAGGHAEIAGFAGLGFGAQEEIPGLLDRLVEDYELFKICGYHKTIGEITDRYLEALGLRDQPAI